MVVSGVPGGGNVSEEKLGRCRWVWPGATSIIVQGHKKNGRKKKPILGGPGGVERQKNSCGAESVVSRGSEVRSKRSQWEQNGPKASSNQTKGGSFEPGTVGEKKQKNASR